MHDPQFGPMPTTQPPTRKGTPNWIKVVGVLAAIVAVLGCCGGGAMLLLSGGDAPARSTYHPPVIGPTTGDTKAAPPATGPRKAAVGEVLQWSDEIGNSGTVSVVAVKVAGANVLVTVDYICATGSCTYNMFDWTYLDRSGTPHSQGYAEGVKGELSSGTLAAGQKVHGIVTFERGTDDTHGAQLQYASGIDTLAYFVVA